MKRTRALPAYLHDGLNRGRGWRPLIVEESKQQLWPRFQDLPLPVEEITANENLAWEGPGVVEETFHQRVLADRELLPALNGLSIVEIRTFNYRLARSLLCCEEGFEGNCELRAPAGISYHHLERMAGHLIDELKDRGVAGELTDEVVARFIPLAKSILRLCGR